MDGKVERALRGVVAGMSAAKKGNLELAFQPGPELLRFHEQIRERFEMEAGFLDKMEAFDELFQEQSIFAYLQEFLFDLLLINFFSEDAERYGSEYLESPEWEAIEDETVDRGTEMLNVFLYLQECINHGIEPELDDFLKEFLLVEEEGFQEEFQVYEDVIANQMLMESSYEQISKTAAGLDDSSEMKEFFYPLMGFFYDTKPSHDALREYFRHSQNPLLDVPVLFAILAYHNDLTLWKP